MYYNQVYGKLPASWRLPPGLAFLSLGSNELTGEVPQSLFAQLPPSLRSLYLDDNQLQGEESKHRCLLRGSRSRQLWVHSKTKAVASNDATMECACRCPGIVPGLQ